MNVRTILIGLLAVVAGVIGALAFVPGVVDRIVPGTTVGKALVGGPFQLTDHKGRRVTDESYRGKLMLIFFGFTACPDICPAGLQTVSGALDRLGDKADDVAPLFVTIDPERDTVEQLAAYVSSFHKNVVGLTGSAEEIAKAAKAYRVYYRKVVDNDDYTMDHTSFLYLMGRNGSFITHFPHAVPVDKLAERISKAL